MVAIDEEKSPHKVLFVFLSLTLLLFVVTASLFLIFYSSSIDEVTSSSSVFSDVDYDCDSFVPAFAGGDYSGLVRVNVSHFGINCE